MEQKKNVNEGQKFQKELRSKARSFKHTKSVVRAVFFGLVAFVIIGGSYFLEQSQEVYHGSVVEKFEITDSRVDIPGNAYFVSEGTEISKLLEFESMTEPYLITMNEGRVWGNFDSSLLKSNIIIADKLVIIPSFSNFEIVYEKGVVNLSSFKGNTYIGFLADEVANLGYMDQYSNKLSNVMMLPSGMQAKIHLRKIDYRIKTLLPFKLFKEFGYSFISPNKYKEEFVQKNLIESASFSDMLKDLKRGKFDEDVVDGVSSSFENFLQENLTVVSGKKKQFLTEKLGRPLYDAVLSDDKVLQRESLDSFGEILLSSQSDVVESQFYKDFLYEWYTDLVVFDGFDSEYQVLSELANQSRDHFERSYLFSMQMSLFDESIASGLSVKDSYVHLYEGLSKMYGFTDDATQYRKFLTFYNQLFDSLLLKHPELYQKDLFEMKFDLESELFELYPNGGAKEELKQSLVKRKIDFLKRLRSFFFNGDVELKDARSVMSLLIGSIDDYMPATTSQNAIIDLFEKELADAGDFWGYLNDHEYSQSKLYGSSHKERYEVYIEDRDHVLSILDVQEDVLGIDVVENLNPADVAREVRSALEEVGAASVKVELVSDVHQRFVSVSAVVAGYSFNADYDRDYGVLKNIYAYGQLLTEKGIRLDGIEDLLDGEVAEVVEEVSSEEDIEVSATNAQLIAKSIIAKKISGAGFIAGIGDVEIVDSVEAHYRLSSVSVVQGGDVNVTFDYFANDAICSNLFVLKDGKGMTIKGEFKLVDLKEFVLGDNY